MAECYIPRLEGTGGESSNWNPELATYEEGCLKLAWRTEPACGESKGKEL